MPATEFFKVQSISITMTNYNFPITEEKLAINYLLPPPFLIYLFSIIQSQWIRFSLFDICFKT